MTKTIEISDDVYRRLKREKGDRSFSEVIETALDRRGQIADVAGQGIFDAETAERVSDDEFESMPDRISNHFDRVRQETDDTDA
ncbi:antitoxin VapB family protein [Halapricum hydrolyticum]|uniref:Antitoxin VapB family protein n=1 Tax=Halapricum hydrolyticum TaxID=2979991 RepID=A0AAE3LG83_9EURY|nr:antitoxin VapB family protein [Halapricum hydrolyticum]MCU4719631.1 antitoxin VapB family protein [Halapricum hydrolyticum]MCU4728520.1 antitoxin VapB family protein [Halapricum hydrolyticum]